MKVGNEEGRVRRESAAGLSPTPRGGSTDIARGSATTPGRSPGCRRDRGAFPNRACLAGTLTQWHVAETCRVRTRGACLPLRGQHSLRIPVEDHNALLFPVSPDTSHRAGHLMRGESSSGFRPRPSSQRGDTIVGMLEELDALAAKLTELSGRVRALREENQQLRAQLAAAQAEFENVNTRVDEATERIDALLERLPADTAPSIGAARAK
jgi:cell division protein ZapB